MGGLGPPAPVQLVASSSDLTPGEKAGTCQGPAVSRRCRRLLKGLFLLGINLREVLISLPL